MTRPVHLEESASDPETLSQEADLVVGDLEEVQVCIRFQGSGELGEGRLTSISQSVSQDLQNRYREALLHIRDAEGSDDAIIAAEALRLVESPFDAMFEPEEEEGS